MVYLRYFFTSILLLNLNLGHFAVSGCGGGIKLCEAGKWMPWGNCSQICGGGIMKRSKFLCCDPNKGSIYETCVRNCNISNQHLHEEKGCNQDCFNGIFNVTKNKCQCSGNFTGDCCQHPVGNGEDNKGNAGTVVGICLGVIAAVVTGLLFAFCLFKRWKQQKEKVTDSETKEVDT